MQSDAVNEIAAALAKAQGQIKNPTKNKNVSVTTKAGNAYDFQYADLAAIFDAVRKPLADNGLCVVQYIEEVEGKWRLHTRILHNSGQWIGSVNPLFLSGLGEAQTSQAFGSAMTFMKRYALSGLLGVAADDDDDANVADGNTITAASVKKEPVISPEQADELLEIITTKGVDINQFLRKAGCPSVSDLPAARYDAAKKWLQEQGAVRS